MFFRRGHEARDSQTHRLVQRDLARKWVAIFKRNASPIAWQGRRGEAGQFGIFVAARDASCFDLCVPSRPRPFRGDGRIGCHNLQTCLRSLQGVGETSDSPVFLAGRCPIQLGQKRVLRGVQLGIAGPFVCQKRNYRFPVVVCPHHACSQETHEAIMRVIQWSLESLAEGRWPTRDPDDQPFASDREGEFGYLAAIGEWKGDWKMMSALVGVPHWRAGDGICWRCKILLENVREVGLDASWRRPDQRIGHAELVSNLQARGKLGGVWNFPRFSQDCIRIDWLHCMDQGVSAMFFGGLLHLAVTLAMYGPNQSARARHIFRLILVWYRANRVQADRLKALPLTRFKPKNARPQLKASAGQVRALVPFFLELVRGWEEHMFVADVWAEVLLLKRAAHSLWLCYECLSLSRPRPLTVLQEESVAFAQVLVQLEGLKPARYTVTPKLHLLMELALEGSRPSQSWCYRDEDFGGFLAGVARRRGGHDSALATSRNTLNAFMAKQPLPAIGQEEA